MPSKSTTPVKKSNKTKASKTLTAKIPQVKFIKGSTDVLVIAPHGVNKKGVKRDDIVGVLVGILLSIIGTMMLRNPAPRPVYTYDDDDEEEPLEERRFRL